MKHSCGSGILPIAQPRQNHARYRAALEKYTDEQLHALALIARESASLILALAVAEGRVGAEEACRIARLEEDFQAEQWGDDEDILARHNRARKVIFEAAKILVK